MSVSSRRSRVASCFAVITQRIAAFRMRADPVQRLHPRIHQAGPAARVGERRRQKEKTGEDNGCRIQPESARRPLPDARHEQSGEHAWTAEEFYELGRSDWQDFRKHLEAFGVPGHDTVLEIGCGAGRLTKHLVNDYGRVIGVDVSPGMLEAARKQGSPSLVQYRMEIPYSQFERALELPCDLKRAAITTEFKDGMLLVRIDPEQ